MPVKVFRNMSLNDEVNPAQGEQNPVITGAQNETNDVRDAAQESQVTRELTQTDRINKHLLKSFLDRINASDQIIEQFSTNTSQTTPGPHDHDDFEEQLFIGTQIM